MTETKEFLNIDELATLLKCSTGLIHKLKNTGTIPFIKIGTCIRFEKNEVLKSLEKETNENF